MNVSEESRKGYTRVTVRTIGVVILGFVSAVLMALTSTATSIVALAANTTALIMGGTGQPLTIAKNGLPFIESYLSEAVNNYISPASTATPSTGIPQGPYNSIGLITPEQFYPNGALTFDQSVAQGVTDLDNCITAANCEYDVGDSAPTVGDSFVAFGYSQSATIATLEKRKLAAEYPNGGGPDVYFVLTANGNRPNGGYLARGPVGVTIPKGLSNGGVTFSGPTPTDTQYDTVDVAIQYDNWADSPVNPLNLLAVINAQMGGQQLHFHYIDGNNLDQPGVIDQGQYGDTHYYLISTPILPILRPVQDIPVVGNVLADALDAPLRVLVEAGYDRTVSPGQYVPWNPLYTPNPVTLAVNLAVSIPTGWDNAVQDIAGIRPFGTVRPGPYGVGGPPVTYVNPPTTTTTSQTTESTESTSSSSADASTASVKSATLKTDLAKADDKTSDSSAGAATTAVRTPSVTNPTKVVSDPEDAGKSSETAKQDEPVKDSTTTSSAAAKGDATEISKPTSQTGDGTQASKPAPDGTRGSQPRVRHHPNGPDASHQTTNAPSADAGKDGSADGGKASASSSSDSASSQAGGGKHRKD